MRCPGARGRWSAALLPPVATFLVLTGTVLVTPATTAAQASVVGQWRTLPYTTPINPIHVALLRTGKVLIASGTENDPTETVRSAAAYDPVAGTITPQTIAWDLFCSGMTHLPDGRIITTGGTLQYNPFRGIRTTTIFDPATETFIQAPDMAHGRWYPTPTALPDGRTSVFGGWTGSGAVNNAVEIFALASGWSPQFPAPFTPSLYPWLHVLPDGRLFYSGSSPGSHILDPASMRWTLNVAQTNFGLDRRYGSSVLLPLLPSLGYAPRVMIMGGHLPNATATAELIDLSQPGARWQNLPPMSAPRVEMNAVMLPTGKVLAIGGSAQDEVASTASLGADLFDQATRTWSPAGTGAMARLYHSVALLLPDATVWVAGSNPFQGTYENRMEIYSPAYLFTTTATGAVVRAARPSITGAPSKVGYGGTIQVQTPDAASIRSVVLMKLGAATHGFDMDQRLVGLNFTAGTGSLAVTTPPNAAIAPPGYYMLFVLNAKGVPSVARILQLSPTPANSPPQGTITAPPVDITIAAGQPVTFAGSGADTDGTVTAYQWVFPGGSPATSDSATPGAVVFNTPGTYVVSLTVLDDAGESDPSPPTRTITVQSASGALAASFASPPAGSTVSGTPTIVMSAPGGAAGPRTFTLAIDGTTVSAQTVTGTLASYPWDTTGAANGLHTLALTVTDSTSATATASTSLTVQNGPTGTLDVSFTTPAPGDVVSGTAWANVWLGGNAPGTSTFTLSQNGATVWSQTGTDPHVTLPWDTTRGPNGSQTLVATVVDSAGNSGTASVAVTVQNATPGASLTASFTSPPAGGTVSGTQTIVMSAPGGAAGSLTFKLALDGALVFVQASTATTVSFAWDTTTASNASHTLTLTVTDSSGAAASATRTVTVQNATALPPAGGTLDVSFTTPAPGDVVAGTAWANVWLGGNAPGPSTFALSVNGVTVWSQTSTDPHVTLPWDTTGTANGTQTLVGTVTDSAGNSGSAAVSVTVQN